MKNRLNKVAIAFIVALIIIFIFNMLLYSSKKKMSDLSLNNYVKVEHVNTSSTDVHLITPCNTISMSPTSDQIYSIQKGLEGRIRFRPLTHDLIKSIFDNYRIEVVMAKINDYKNGIYFAKLIIKQGNKMLSIDSRPSDAVAIAVRFNKPIYVKESILVYGLKLC